MILATINATASRRKRRALSTVDVERSRIRALPAVRMLSGRFAMPIATAVLMAQAAGLNVGGDR